MRHSLRGLMRLLALLAALAMIAAACGDGDDGGDADGDADTAADTDSDAESDDDAMADDDSADDDGGEDHGGDDDDGEEAMANDGAMADDSLAPVKIGLIAQDEELFAFPEVRANIQAYVDFFNAEMQGADGHPIELEVCGAGDAAESHVACAQQFVNDDSVHLVINGGFLANSIASGTVLSDAGKPSMALGNDFGDYFLPNVSIFDPGLPGLAQVFFVFANKERGITTMTLFIADDPAFEPFVPALEAIAESNGITITEVIPLGFEPDLTGPISAADTANEGWLFVLGDGAQCTAGSAGVATVGYEGQLFANDLCAGQDVVESGAVDGWSVPIVSSAPTVDGDGVDEIARVLDTYGSADSQTAGLGGWALGNAWIARDVLIAGGLDGATDATVGEALGSYSSSDVPGFPTVTCPGPSVWAGACNTSPLMVTVADGEMTSPDGFVSLDFGELDFLLE